MSSYPELSKTHSQMQSHRIGELLGDNSVFIVKLPNLLKNMMANRKNQQTPLDLAIADIPIGTMQNVRVHCGPMQDEDERDLFGSDSESDEASQFKKIEGTIVFSVLGKRLQMDEQTIAVDVTLPLSKED